MREGEKRRRRERLRRVRGDECGGLKRVGRVERVREDGRNEAQGRGGGLGGGVAEWRGPRR